MRRRICVVTGTRAEYGLLRWLMAEIQGDPRLELQVAVTGMHLAPEFGSTHTAITGDGFAIDATVDTLLASNTAVGTAKSIGLGVIGFSDAFATLRPHIVVVLGDRYEILAAVQSAMVCNIPVAHLHGGEVTEGAMDEGIRHAITKMATFHFVAAEPYRDRVLRLGEQPNRVWVVGAPGLDNVDRLPLLDAEALGASVGLAPGKRNFLVTYHPVTLAQEAPDAAVRSLCEAMDRFPDAHVIFTKANADTGGLRINSLLETYVAAHPRRAVLSASLGQQRYLSAVKHADVVIGNSSSGLIEAPVLRTPTVNIGARQRGRLRAESVIDTDESVAGIVQGIQEALSPAMRERVRTVTSRYGRPGASAAIKDILAQVSLDGVQMKTFYDGDSA